MKMPHTSVIPIIFIVLFIIVISVFMFWDKGENFLTPETFNVIGDTLFPLNINYANSFFYAWDSRGNFGLGQVNTSAYHLPMYFFVWLWSLLGHPMWIANRLWHIFPNVLVGVGGLYLYRSLFNGKYSWFCGAIASVFIMFLPDRGIFPHGGTGFAGTLFSLGAIIRGIFSEYTGSSKKGAIGIFSFGVLMSVHYFHCFYITVITIGSIIVLTLFCRGRERQKYMGIIKLVLPYALIALLFNTYWIIPFSLQLFNGAESLWMNPEIMKTRNLFHSVHQAITNPVYILRATTGGAGSGRPSQYYFSHPLILPFTFLIPLYCFLPLLLKHISKKIRILALVSILFSIYPAVFHFSPSFNMFLRNHIPTFWTMNEPTFWMLYIGTCYGLIIGSVTEHFLILLDEKKLQKIVLAGSVCIVVFIFGGGVLFDRALVPGSVLPYTVFGNKAPYVKIPDEYSEFEKYLAENAGIGGRVWYVDMGGFKRYTWAYNTHMPEIVFFKSPITALGQGMSFVSPMIDLLKNSINSEKYSVSEGLNLILFMGKVMNIEYIFVHKDYYDKGDIDLCDYVRDDLVKNDKFKIVMDNNYFSLYENKDPYLNVIYSAEAATLVKGDIDMFSLIAQTRADIEKPIYIFAKRLQKIKNDVKNTGIKDVVYKYDKPRGGKYFEVSKIVLMDGAEREKEEKLHWLETNKNKIEDEYIAGKDVEFEIPRDGDYIIKAKVSSRIIEKDIKDNIQEIRFGKEELKDWSFSPRRVTYDCSIDKSLCLPLYFDGDENEDEFLQMQNSRIRIDLKEHPYLGLTYKIEDSMVQTIEIVAGIDFDKDGLVNEYIRSIYPSPAAKAWTNYSCNLYDITKHKFPDKKYYDLVFLEIYPHKLWGVDCSSPERRGKYIFWIKKLQFYNYSPVEFFEVTENVLNVKMDSSEEIKKWKLRYPGEDYGLDINDNSLAVVGYEPYFDLSRDINRVDLNRFSFIELEYSTKGSSVQSIKFFLSVDFNKDGISDADVFAGDIPFSKDFNKVQIDARKILKNNYPGEQDYCLTRIKFRLNGLGPNYDKSLFNLKSFRVYSYQLVSPANVKFYKPVVKLDGQKIWFSKKIRVKNEFKNLWLKKIVHLRKGKHSLKRLTGRNFNVDWVTLEPASEQEKVENKNGPDIVFKKINPSRYKVEVKGANGPFWLVLSESFHNGWKIYHGQEGITKYLFKRPLDVQHLLVNGYSNGWFIEPQKLGLGGDFTLEIYFWPQSLFYLGLGISGFSMLLYLGFAGMSVFNRRIRKELQ